MEFIVARQRNVGQMSDVTLDRSSMSEAAHAPKYAKMKILPHAPDEDKNQNYDEESHGNEILQFP